MKKIISIVCLAVLCLAAHAQGIQFTEGTWSEILEKAKTGNRPVFVDVYTVWCGPCKKMAKEIFTQKEAGDYFNAHFINYKIDAEKGEGRDIARRFNVTAYPTCLFITPEGKLISSFMGAQTVAQLVREGEKAVRNYSILPELEKLDAEYAQGGKDVAFLQKYCRMRSDFGTKGGQPVNDLLNKLTDTELTAKENIEWVQSMTVYDEALLQRLVDVLKGMDKADKKAVTAYNGAIMKSLSTLINQCIDTNLKAEFEKLMDFKQQMVAIDNSNANNAVMASLGGGMSYIGEEQLRMTFYIKNHYDEEFSKVFTEYLNKEMAATPADSLIARSDATEKAYVDMMKSDTISDDEKADMERARGMMNLFTVVQGKMLAVTLYNAAEHYWKLNAPQSDELKAKYITWLKFFYALDRSANIAIPASEKLVELGAPDKAKAMLQDLVKFLQLKGDPDKELDKVQAALAKIK